MKIYIHLWQCLVELFLEWEMFQTKIVEKIETHFMINSLFYAESSAVYDNAWKKNGRARQVTDDHKKWTKRIAFWITKVTNMHSEYVVIIAFARQWLCERVWMSLLYVDLHCLILFSHKNIINPSKMSADCFI
jgi:hypothetical protein